MYYYEILPLKKTGAEDRVFTYISETEIELGNLVTIPLRNRKIKGIVMAACPKPSFSTRPIEKILTTEPPVTDIQLELAKRIARYYLCSLGDAISSIFPFEFGKKRRAQKENPKDHKIQSPNKLTSDQQKTYDAILKSKEGSRFLLFGVTGSGKTEIYLQLIADALKKDQGAIVLVPEISLTPQIMDRFHERFGDQVAVWHSQMLETEKYFTWEKIKSGQTKVVVGARSAIFTPVRNLAYVVIDEEHEGSYKQDQNPRYEATRVAEWLTELTGAKLVLGSATPRIETYQKALQKEYSLVKLDKRIVQENMPPVKLVDLRQEYQKGNRSIFSDDLLEACEEALKAKKQVLLFVNRRGAATFVICRDCGTVSECPNCDIPLTYHPSEGQVLKCHHCDYKTTVPTICPNCQSYAIKYFGLGTQKAELEAKKMFPGAKVARMDRDTTAKRGSHESLFRGFLNEDFDILIGTQIIAKGWDLPNVAVVGVISADTTLNIPDFRAGERTFDLLTQVAGRTGRGFHPGKVIIQTYNPEAYPIVAAAQHDYVQFFEQEITERQKYSYPPFCNLIKLTCSETKGEKALQRAEELAAKITSDYPGIKMLGPVPAFIPKLGNNYRYHLVLKLDSEVEPSSILADLKDSLAHWAVDINPETLL